MIQNSLAGAGRGSHGSGSGLGRPQEEDVLSIEGDVDNDSVLGSPSRRSWRSGFGSGGELAPSGGFPTVPKGLSAQSQPSLSFPGNLEAGRPARLRENRGIIPFTSGSPSPSPSRASTTGGDPENHPSEEDAPPSSWDSTLHTVANLCGLSLPEADAPERTSILSKTFGDIGLPKPKSELALPAEGVMDMKWGRVNKSLPKTPHPDESRMRRQYRWPDADFERMGRVPMVDKAVSTYMSTKVGGFGKFKPRTLYPTESKLDKSLQAVDHLMRSQQRVSSHMSYMLVALRKALAADSQASEEDISAILSSLAQANCDLATLAITASARCTAERRQLYVDALNLPDKADNMSLLKLPMGGHELFNGKFNEIAKESSQLRRDAREMAETMVSTSHQQRSGKSADNKRKPAEALGAPTFKRLKKNPPVQKDQGMGSNKPLFEMQSPLQKAYSNSAPKLPSDGGNQNAQTWQKGNFRKYSKKQQ